MFQLEVTGYLMVNQLLSLTSPLCSMNKYIDIIISQETTQFYAQYVQYISQLHVSAHLSHLQVVPYTLASVVA